MAGARRAVGAVMLAALCLLVGACTPSPGETPSPTPMSPVSASPTENAVERQQRLDFEAAEKSYREFQEEIRRVLRSGGARAATTTIRRTTDGPFLAETTSVVQAFKQQRYHQAGDQKVVFVRRVGYSSSRLVMDICEDGRDVTTLDQDDKVVGKNDLRRSEISFMKREGSWKIWSADGRKVSSCE